MLGDILKMLDEPKALLRSLFETAISAADPARVLARHLRADIPDYIPFVPK